MKEENIKAVEKFLNALRTRDLSLAPLADEMKFEDSVAGKGNGAENLLRLIRVLFLKIFMLRGAAAKTSAQKSLRPVRC